MTKRTRKLPMRPITQTRDSMMGTITWAMIRDVIDMCWSPTSVSLAWSPAAYVVKPASVVVFTSSWLRVASAAVPGYEDNDGVADVISGLMVKLKVKQSDRGVCC